MSERSQAFSSRALGWIIGLCVASFLFAFLVAAYGDDLTQPRSAGADTFSYSAVGHRALVEFLERSGVEVTVRRSRHSRPFGPRAPLFVLEPAGQLGMKATALLELHDMALAADAALIVVMPKWLGFPRPNRSWVDRVALLPSGPIEEGLAEFLDSAALQPLELDRADSRLDLECEDSLGRSYAVDLDSPQWLAPADEWEPIVQCSDRIFVSRWSGGEDEDPALFLISDPDLLNNHGLIRGQHADLVIEAILNPLTADRAIVDETIHGFARSDGVAAELLRFPLVVPVVHLLIVAGVAIWSGAGRFGRPEPVTPRLARGKRVLIDNAAQLLNLGGHSAEALESYYDQTLRAVGRHFFFRPDMPLEELCEKLQTISRDRGLATDLDALHKRITRAGKERGVRLANDLHRWRLEMTHDG